MKHTMTGAGMIVVLTTSTVTAMLYGTICVVYVRRGEVDVEMFAAASGALLGLLGLLARTRPDPAATVEAPAHVEATSLTQQEAPAAVGQEHEAHHEQGDLHPEGRGDDPGKAQDAEQDGDSAEDRKKVHTA